MRSKTDGMGRKIGLQERREMSQEESKRRIRGVELQAERMKEKYGGSWAKERKENTHRHTHNYTNSHTHRITRRGTHTVTHSHSHTYTVTHVVTYSHTQSHIHTHTVTHMHTQHHTHQRQAGEELEATG